MTESLDAAAARSMLEAVARKMVDSVDLLTEVDQAIGDGDHGIGMRRGFAGVLEQLPKDNPASVEATFKSAGTAIMAKTGGAAGAVFGTLFRAGSAAFAGHDLDAATFAAFLRTGLEAVMKRGGAHAGQKTMIDALAPAAAAAEAAVGQGLSAVVTAAAEAAEGGVEATKAMIATTGKARTLGERSLGHADPGAVSTNIILQVMRAYVVGA